jgi:hypothetical protein
MSNPFTYGNPISDPERFFGREREIEQLVARLRNVEFESTSIVGDRRIGKTSILMQLAHPDVRRRQALADDKIVFVYEDLQMVEATVTPTRLWRRLLQRLSRQMPADPLGSEVARAAEQDPIDTFLLDEVFDTIDDSERWVILLLDEFEHITQNENFGADFFYALRSMAIHHHLALVTSSRRELVELCHSDSIRSSPFFNIFAHVWIRALPSASARDFMLTSLEGSGVTFSVAERDLIATLAGTHPFFLQMACHQLYEAHVRGRDEPARKRALAAEFREQAQGHFRDSWQNCDDREKIVLTALTLLERGSSIADRKFKVEALQDIYNQSDQTLERLDRRGLLKQSDSGYSLFSISLGDWIIDELRGELSERQTYDSWLAANESSLATLPGKLKAELNATLPQIAARYREMFISWASNPQQVVSVLALLRGVVGL